VTEWVRRTPGDNGRRWSTPGSDSNLDRLGKMLELRSVPPLRVALDILSHQRSHRCVEVPFGA
jgi:hypothetical protein